MSLSLEALPLGERSTDLGPPSEGGRVTYSKIKSASEAELRLELSSKIGDWHAWFPALEPEVLPTTSGFSLRLLFGLGLKTDLDDPAANAFHVDETQWWTFLVDRLSRHFEDEEKRRGKPILFPESEVLYDQKRQAHPLQLLGRCRLFYEALALYCQRSGKPKPVIRLYDVNAHPVDLQDCFVEPVPSWVLATENWQENLCDIYIAHPTVVFNSNDDVLQDYTMRDLLGPPYVQENGHHQSRSTNNPHETQPRFYTKMDSITARILRGGEGCMVVDR